MKVTSSMASQQDEAPGDKRYFSAMRRELTLDKLWHLRTWGEIFKHFSTALMISALPTFFDMFTDAFSAKSFINGKNYTKFVTNLSNPAFHEKCVHVGRYITFQPEEEIQYEEIECFETDVIWGGVTVLLIFLPGFFFAVDVSIISGCKHNHL